MSLPALRDLLHRPITTGLAIAATATTLLWWTGSPIGALTMTPAALENEPWRLLTSALPHADLLHLAFNLYWLLILGGAVEARCGALVTLGLVLVTSIGSATLEHALFSGGVGLSGIGYGLFAFTWESARRGRDFTDVMNRRAAQTFAAWFVFCCVTTLAGILPVANAAHAGGWGIGLLAGQAWVRRPRNGAALAGTGAAVLLCVGLATASLRAVVNLHGLEEDLAAEAYTLIESEPARAVSFYNQALARDDTVANWHYNRGVALERLGRMEDAHAAWERALALEPESADYRSALASAHAHWANEALEEGRYDDAAEALRKALEVSPHDELAGAWRATLQQLGQ